METYTPSNLPDPLIGKSSMDSASELKLNISASVFVPKQVVIVKDYLKSNTLSGRLLIALIESNFLLAKSFIDDDVRLNLTESEKYYPNLLHNLEELLQQQKNDEAFIILQCGIKFKFIFNPLSKLLSNLLVKIFLEKNQKYISILMLHEIKLLPENLSENTDLSTILKEYLIDGRDNKYNLNNSIFLINTGINLPQLNSEEELLFSNLFKKELLQNNLEMINFYRKQNIKIIDITEEEKSILSIFLKNSLLTNNIKIVDILMEHGIKLPVLNITDEFPLSEILNNALLNYKNINNQYKRIMNQKLIKILIELNIKINKNFIYLDNFENLVILLKESLLENNKELIDYLLKAGLELNDIEKYDKSLSSIFREAILKKNIELCNLFLSNNVKLNMKDKNYFKLLDLVFLSVKNNDINMVRICILADVYYRMYNARKFNIANIFLLACHFNKIEIIKFFFTEEFNIAYPNFNVSYTLDNGETGLMLLTKHKNLEVINFILQRNSGELVPKVGPMDTEELFGSSLAGACEGLHQENKIDINKINLDESSALTFAYETNFHNCNDKIISVLIQN